MFRRKWSFVVCTLLLAVGVFSACSKSETAEGTRAAAAPEKLKLDVVVHQENYPMEAMFNDFARLHPNIEFTWEIGQNVDTGVYSSIMADPECGGIYQLGSGASRIMPLADAGLLLDLTDIYTERGWDKKVEAATIDIIKRTSNGRLYEVSNGKDVFVIKYWYDDFEKYGVEPPKTYEDFWTMLEKIKSQGQTPVVVGVSGSGSPAGHWMSYFWQCIGGKEFVEGLLYGDTPFTDPRSIEAARDYYRMIERGYFNSDALALDSTGQRTSFISRKNGYPMLSNMAPQLEMYADMADLSGLGTFYIPAKDPKNTMPVAGLAQTWVVAANSKQREAALIFLDYILSPDYPKVLATITGGWNAGIGSSIIEDIDALNIPQDYIKTALLDLGKGSAYNCSPYLPGTIRTVYIEAIQEMFAKALTPEGVMQKLQAAKEEYLKTL